MQLHLQFLFTHASASLLSLVFKIICKLLLRKALHSIQNLLDSTDNTTFYAAMYSLSNILRKQKGKRRDMKRTVQTADTMCIYKYKHKIVYMYTYIHTYTEIDNRVASAASTSVCAAASHFGLRLTFHIIGTRLRPIDNVICCECSLATCNSYRNTGLET